MLHLSRLHAPPSSRCKSATSKWPRMRCEEALRHLNLCLPNPCPLVGRILARASFKKDTCHFQVAMLRCQEKRCCSICRGYILTYPSFKEQACYFQAASVRCDTKRCCSICRGYILAAPASRSKRATCKWPPWDARRRGVAPPLPVWSLSAPASSRSKAAASLPNRAAACKAAIRPEDTRLGS